MRKEFRKANPEHRGKQLKKLASFKSKGDQPHVLVIDEVGCLTQPTPRIKKTPADIVGYRAAKRIHQVPRGRLANTISGLGEHSRFHAQ